MTLMRRIGLLIGACLLVATGFADGRGYEARTVPIYAGVGKFSENDTNVRDHYTFYVLERRNDVKPLGLTFLNPYAPAGTTRDQAAYWEVNLHTISDTEITRYRVLLLSRTDWRFMTPEIFAKLRRFVEAGGVLWIDKPYVPAPPAGNIRLYFPDVEITGGLSPITTINLNHPLLNGYYRLSPGEIAQVGLRGRGLMDGRLNLITGGRPPLQIVAADASGPVIAACTYGSGRIVVSAAGVASAINRPFITRSGAMAPRARETLVEAVPDLDLKFAYNIVRWVGSSIAPNVNLRGANAIGDQYGAPLGVRWRNKDETLTPRDGAVIYGGLLFATTGGKLVCYDMQPSRDLDGDGLTDDGIRDMAEGKTYDKVWEVALSGQASASIIAETPSGTQVIVLVGTSVEGYWALPRDPSTGIILPAGQRVWQVSNPVGGSIPSLPDGRLPAPVLIDNTLLIVPSYHSAGTVMATGFYAVALGDGRNPQVVQSSNAFPPQWYQPRSGGASGTWLLPVVAGMVPNRGVGGGDDIVLYYGSRREPPSGSGNTNEGVQSFWISARGEVLTPALAGDGSYLGFLRCRITGQAFMFVPSAADPALRPLRPRVYRYDEARGLLEDITDSGLVTFSDESTTPGESGRVFYSGPLSGYRFFIDYYIDWARTTNSGVMFRSFAQLPPSSGNEPVPPNKLQGITLGPNGVLYITTGTESTDPNIANGNLIALLEQTPPRGGARGGSMVLWRWQSHGGYVQILRGGSEWAVDGATLWKEPNAVLDGFLGSFVQFNHSVNPNNRAMNFTFRHAPVYYDGAIYALGEGQVRLGPIVLPYTILLAFDAEQNNFAIDLGAPITSGTNLQISQRDYGRSGPQKIYNVSSNISYSEGNPNPLLLVDYTRGQIRFTAFAQSSSGGTVNLLDNVLSISQPVVVTVGTEAPFVVDPDKIAGNWNNLRWYAVLFGVQAQGPPVVVGDNVYLPVVAQFPNSPPGSGILALGADPYRLQPNLPARKAQAGTIPYVSQGYRSIIRWPYIDDLVDESALSRNPFAFFREFITRFAETLRLGGQVSPIYAGEGALVVGSSEGLHAYARQGTLIADEGRIVEVDSAGRVVWATENTQLEIPSGAFVPSKAKYALTPNARVYRYGDNELLIVEPERNRVAIIDRAGYELRIITRFLPDVVPQYDAQGRITGKIDLRDPARAPSSNYVSGTPDTLRNPTDVTVWTEFVPESRNPYLYRLPLEYWIHYTISDAGNNRVVDIVDRYQVNPRTFEIGPPVQHPQLGAMLGVLYWMTPATILGRQYKYVSAQRFEYWDGSQIRVGFATLVQNVAVEGTLAGNSGSPNTDPATPEAGMITIELADRTLYIRKMQLPDGRIVPILGPVAIDTARRSATGQGNAGLYLLLTTSTGVYELAIPTSGTITDTAPVSWMVTNEAYSYALRRRFDGLDLVRGSDNLPLQPILFKPRQARYLFNGNVLIVNQYSGATLVQNGNQQEERVFPGEVLEIKADDYDSNDTSLSDGTLYGFRPSSILWSTADRPAMSGSSPLRKPSSADRGF